MRRWYRRSRKFSTVQSKLMLVTTAIFASIFLSPHAISSEWTKKATELKLVESAHWLKLLHYKEILFFSPKSRIDDPKFFLAKAGAIDATGELKSEINALFDKTNKGDLNFGCRFPLRKKFLVSQLKIPATSLTSTQCPAYTAFKEKFKNLKPKFVFLTPNLGSVSSIFGQTLLRFGNSRNSIGVDFGIDPNTNTGLFHSYKWLLGKYSGNFSHDTYENKYKNSAHIESRNTWEYPLRIDAAETAILIDHLWELSGVKIDYYYLDENSSRYILELLSVIKPKIEFQGMLPLWTFPVGSIRTLKSWKLLGKPRLKLSPANQIRSVIAELDLNTLAIAQSSIDQFHSLSDLDWEDAEPSMQGLGLDLISEHLNYTYRLKEISKEEFTTKSAKLRAKRKSLPKAKAVPIAVSPPETGHGTFRMELAGGVVGPEKYYGFGIRPFVHGSEDPQKGFAKGQSLEFMNIFLRHRPERDQFEVKRTDFLKIRSMNPWDSVIQPLSWSFSTGYQLHDYIDEKRIQFVTEALGGLSFTIDKLELYGLLGPEIIIATDQDLLWSAGLKAEVGVSSGSYLDWLIQIRAVKAVHPWDSVSSISQGTFSVTSPIWKHMAGNISFTGEESMSNQLRTIQGSLNYYP